MFTDFATNISSSVNFELGLAHDAKRIGDTNKEFSHLENAHVLGQESTYWHVKVHFLMFLWGMRNLNLKETLGQVLRIFGALTKTVFGLVPQGNTGGANVSPFKVMPLSKEHQRAITKAKKGE